MPGDDPERLGVLAALAGEHYAAGQFAQARDTLVDCLAQMPPETGPQRTELIAMCAALEHLIGRHDEAHARLTGALAALDDDRSAQAISLIVVLGIDGLFRMDYEAMHDWGVRAVAAAQPSGVPALVASATSLLALGSAFHGAVADGLEAAAEAAAALDPMDDGAFAGSLEPAARLAAAELYLEDYDAASRHIERTLAVARGTGRGNHLPILFWAGVIRWMRGDLAGAAGLLDEAVEIARLTGHREGQAWNLFVRSQVATSAGEAELALAAAEESVEAMRAGVPCFPKTGAGLAHAAALLGVEDPQAATDALLFASGGEHLPLVPIAWRTGTLELLTRCRLALGDAGEAARIAGLAERQADRLGQRMARAMADRAVAAVALARDDPPLAADRALRSATGFDEVGAVVEGAFSRVLAGRALAAQGESEAAGAELLRGAAVLDERGAVSHRDAAERELRRLGHRRLHRRSRPGDLGAGGVDSLTERELEVARLVVDRRTNPQIAAELFLSQKTVETHMRNLFHKLDVSSRVEVARAIERADRMRSGRAPTAS
jgi:ATP/maltotriose-dependent transcriptional regulator MalT